MNSKDYMTTLELAAALEACELELRRRYKDANHNTACNGTRSGSDRCPRCAFHRAAEFLAGARGFLESTVEGFEAKLWKGELP